VWFSGKLSLSEKKGVGTAIQAVTGMKQEKALGIIAVPSAYVKGACQGICQNW
jgi:hypothetical protein